MTKTIEGASAAIVELPPPPPAYVVTYGVISGNRCEHLDCAATPPGEPPHGHEHTDPGEPRRINLSEELGLTENLTPVVIRKGSDV
jgi:hypothetical protein